MKKILNLIIALSFMTTALVAKAQVTIGKNVTDTNAVGVKSDSYYTVILANTDLSSEITTSFVFYIPNEIFANGTYDLVYLPSEVNSIDEAVEQCQEDQETGDDTVTLPSNDKVYVIGSRVKLKQKGKFFRGKGLSLAEKNFKGAQITISGIGSAETSPLIEQVTLAIADVKLPFTKVNYKVFITEDCEEIAKKSKFKVSKKAKRIKFEANDTATVITTEVPNF